MDRRDVAILIVAYRSAALLDECLRSAKRHLPCRPILVWDNSPPDDAVRAIAELHPDVSWHFSEENIGFAAAVNRLARLVRGRDMLLLNPDAELLCSLPRTLAALREPGVAAVAPMVEDRSPRAQPWDVAHHRLTFANALGTVAGLGERLRGTPLSNLYRGQPDAVDGYLAGACLAISRAAWDDVGPFDEEFFLYGEEADWQGRAIARGWRIHLAGEIGVRHRAMGTVAGDRPAARRSVDLLRANQALELERRYGRWTADAFLAWLSAVDILRRRLYRRPVGAATDLLMTVDGPDSVVQQRISDALVLAQAGNPITVVALRRLGDLPRRLPPPIRLIRGAWWWPSATPEAMPRVLVAAHSPTPRERWFARIFRLRRRLHSVISR